MLRICWMLITLLLASTSALAETTRLRQFIRIGVLSFEESSKSLSRWQPTIDYLNQRLPQYQFTLVSGDIKSIDQLVASGTIDFVITNGVRLIIYQNNYHAVRMLNLRPLEGDPQFAIGSAIITRSEHPPVSNWQQIRSLRVVATMPQAFGGFQVAQREWLKAGLDAQHQLQNLRFVGLPQEALLTMLVKNAADVAILPTCVLERAVKAGQFSLSQFSVVLPRPSSHLPCLSSTELYPYWSLSRMAHVEEGLAREVAQLLLELRPSDLPATQGEYLGWTIPINDNQVVGLMRDLDMLGENNPLQILWQKYRGWLLISVGGLLLLLGYHMRVNYLVRIRTRQLQQAMTQNQQAAEALQQQQEQFYSAQRVLLSGELAAGLAHELNQPLMAINSYVVGCRMRLQQPGVNIVALDHALESALQQTANARDVIKRIRDFSHKHTEKRSHFLLNTILENALRLFSHELKRQHIQLVFTDRTQLPVHADEVLIQQVIVNLISNALDAINASSHATSGRLTFSLSQKAEQAILLITDNGIGMSDQQREYLFVPFCTSKPEGLGLGMIISQRIIAAHGGEIWTQPSDSGVCIGFSLPLSQGIQDE